MHRKLLASVVFGAAVCGALPAYAGGVSVALDEVRTITFPKQVATVYVGNPAIADINMIDARHAFIIGKGFGNTNVVALDQDGKPVSNTGISVLGKSGAQSVVTLDRGTERVTYGCTSSNCEVTPMTGDNKTLYDFYASENDTHVTTAKKAPSPTP
jgi:Flp pilus assembly secretin CpaC